MSEINTEQVTQEGNPELAQEWFALYEGLMKFGDHYDFFKQDNPLRLNHTVGTVFHDVISSAKRIVHACAMHELYPEDHDDITMRRPPLKTENN